MIQPVRGRFGVEQGEQSTAGDGDQDHFLKPRIPAADERGSRRPERPSSTSVKKSNKARLKASGSSILMVCPECGRTASPEVAMLRFMSSAGSRHGSSSSPVMMSVGTSIFFIPSTGSHGE